MHASASQRSFYDALSRELLFFLADIFVFINYLFEISRFSSQQCSNFFIFVRRIFNFLPQASKQVFTFLLPQDRKLTINHPKRSNSHNCAIVRSSDRLRGLHTRYNNDIAASADSTKGNKYNGIKDNFGLGLGLAI